jgi:SAM-dependent methyltransferase
MQETLPDYVVESLACPFCGGTFEKRNDGLKCTSCNDLYPYRNHQPDLRINRKKTLDLKFDIGLNPFPGDNFDFNPLRKNDSPEVDYSNFSSPTRLSKVQMSYIPKAKYKGSKMLDLGCGHAFHRAVCEHAGYQYVGLDYDEPEAPLLGDAHALPFKDEQFDFILSIAVLEHIINPFVMMRETFRVLKPGGKLIGTVSFLEPFHANSCYHHTHLGTYYTLKSSGFNVEKVAPSADWPVLVAQSGILFRKLPRPISRFMIMPIHLLHRLWWKTGSLVSPKASERNRILFTTGSFTFIATKPA